MKASAADGCKPYKGIFPTTMVRGLLKILAMRFFVRLRPLRSITALVVASLASVCAASAAEALASSPAGADSCLAPPATFAQASPTWPDAPVAVLSAANEPHIPVPPRWLGETPRPDMAAADTATSVGSRSPPQAS